jgi:hypothetical protein
MRRELTVVLVRLLRNTGVMTVSKVDAVLRLVRVVLADRLSMVTGDCTQAKHGNNNHTIMPKRKKPSKSECTLWVYCNHHIRRPNHSAYIIRSSIELSS